MAQHPCCCVGGYYPPFPASSAPSGSFCSCPDSVPSAWDVTISDMVNFACDCSVLEATYRLTLDDECWICVPYGSLCLTGHICWTLHGSFGCGFTSLGLRACCIPEGGVGRVSWILSFCAGFSERGFNWYGLSGPPFTSSCFGESMEFENGQQALFIPQCNPGGVANLVPVF